MSGSAAQQIRSRAMEVGYIDYVAPEFAALHLSQEDLFAKVAIDRLDELLLDSESGRTFCSCCSGGNTPVSRAPYNCSDDVTVALLPRCRRLEPRQETDTESDWEPVSFALEDFLRPKFGAAGRQDGTFSPGAIDDDCDASTDDEETLAGWIKMTALEFVTEFVTRDEKKKPKNVDALIGRRVRKLRSARKKPSKYITNNNGKRFKRFETQMARRARESERAQGEILMDLLANLLLEQKPKVDTLVGRHVVRKNTRYVADNGGKTFERFETQLGRRAREGGNLLKAFPRVFANYFGECQ